MRKCIIYFFVFLAVAVTLEGRPYDGITLMTIDGKQVNLDKLLDKGPVVLIFWATWCSPCRHEMPLVEKTYREFKDAGISFAAISLDSKRSVEKVRAFLKGRNLTLPVYLDASGKVARFFKVQAIPTTIIITKQHEIVYRERGWRPGNEILLRKHIQSLLEINAQEENRVDQRDLRS